MNIVFIHTYRGNIQTHEKKINQSKNKIFLKRIQHSDKTQGTYINMIKIMCDKPLLAGRSFQLCLCVLDKTTVSAFTTLTQHSIGKSLQTVRQDKQITVMHTTGREEVISLLIT